MKRKRRYFVDEETKQQKSEEQKPEAEQAAKKEEKRETETEKTEAKAGEKPGRQKIEKPKNCSQCNKPIRRKAWYYRNGKYFCGKGCWKIAMEKERGEKAQKAAEAPTA